MTKADVRQTAQECIAQIRGLFPDVRFVFIVVDPPRCLAAVIEGMSEGPVFPTLNGRSMWAVQHACNELLGLSDDARDEIMQSAGMAVKGRQHFH